MDSPNSLLRPVPPEELHDLICVGFGPASLAIAIGLHDALSNSSPVPDLSRGRYPKVAFLERQEDFFWHAGMLLPGAKMQISFIKDLATLRDPRSQFTFLNYLHKHDRLVSFCNLGTFLPLREEYQDYMKWCASFFGDVVSYNQNVVEILPQQSQIGGSKVEHFVVKSQDRSTGIITGRKTHHVVIAVGGKPHIPAQLPQQLPRVVHSSQFSRAAPKLLEDQNRQYNLVVIGGGQSAAEIFDNLQGRYPNAKTTLIVRGSALRPSDDSPFVNEIFDPDRVDGTYNQDAQSREAAIDLDRGTNYGVVRLELLEHIYAKMYTQRLRNPNGNQWQHRIVTDTSVQSISELPGGESVRVFLEAMNDASNSGGSTETFIDADAVFVATGYSRNAHEDMLRPIEHLKPRPNGHSTQWEVSRDYRVQLNGHLASPDVGIWLQGCNEKTHGLSDTLLSILATRGAEIVDSIFGLAGSPVKGTRYSNGFVTPPEEGL
ncbi:MAG: hypothetical protein M1814_003453 [Vezdaea aestivalis]|nr:MAG: hypothetical protein M1814_003453 [Vezdaea aestivalis]